MHKEYADDTEQESGQQSRRRLLLKDQTQEADDRAREESGNSMPPAMKERINGKLQGVYENVSDISTTGGELNRLTQSAVPSYPSSPIPPHPFHLTLSPCPRNPPITLPQPNRRQQPSAFRPRRRTRRRSRRHSQDPVAYESRRRRRWRRPSTLDSLHAPSRPQRLSRCVDDCAGRRGR